VSEALIVMLSIPFTLVGGVWFLWLLDYNWSVAVTIGFLRLPVSSTVLTLPSGNRRSGRRRRRRDRARVESHR